MEINALTKDQKGTFPVKVYKVFEFDGEKMAVVNMGLFAGVVHFNSGWQTGQTSDFIDGAMERSIKLLKKLHGWKEFVSKLPKINS